MWDSNDTDLALVLHERRLKAQRASAELRRKFVNAARIYIWGLLGIAGGAVGGAVVGGPVGMVVGTVAGGVGGFKLGEALVRSEDKK